MGAGSGEVEDDLAERLVNLLEWRVPYTMRPVFGTAVTAQFRLPTFSATVSKPPEGNPDTAGTHLDVDTRGVPQHVSGIQVAEWLTVGALAPRAHSIDAVSHRATATWRKRWQCPRCSAELVGTFAAVAQHSVACGLTEEEEEAGYAAAKAPSTSARDAPAQPLEADASDNRPAGGPAQLGASVLVKEGQEDRAETAPARPERDVFAAEAASCPVEDSDRPFWQPPERRRCIWGLREPFACDPSNPLEGTRGGSEVVTGTATTVSVRAALLRDQCVVTEDDEFLNS